MSSKSDLRAGLSFLAFERRPAGARSAASAPRLLRRIWIVLDGDTMEINGERIRMHACTGRVLRKTGRAPNWRTDLPECERLSNTQSGGKTQHSFAVV